MESKTFFLLQAFLLCGHLIGTSRGQQCKNDVGEPVDWFIAYKPPALKSQSNMLFRKGIGYIYISSKNSTSDWKMSTKSINETTSFLGRTLSILYTEAAKSLHYVVYNDEPPSVPGNTNYGHSKGVVMTDGKVGMWLVHSSPKFPIEPVTVKKDNTTTKNSYFFPSTATRFGQSFLCITLPSNQMDKIGVALQYIKPKIYSQNVPKALEEKFPELTASALKKYKKRGTHQLKIPLKTLGGRDFVSYAKAKEFNKDLYSEWLAPDLKSDLQVETWSNGPGELPSDCRSQYHVMDVKDVEIKVDKQALRFKNSQDHSKWAVTVNSNASIVCIGDINRMSAQFKRGGGTVCYQNAFVWRRYAKGVAEVDPCSLNSNTPDDTRISDKVSPNPKADKDLPYPDPSKVYPTFPQPHQPPVPPTGSKSNSTKLYPEISDGKTPEPAPPQGNPNQLYPTLPTTAGTDAGTPKTTTTAPNKKKRKGFFTRFIDKIFGSKN